MNDRERADEAARIFLRVWASVFAVLSAAAAGLMWVGQIPPPPVKDWYILAKACLAMGCAAAFMAAFAMPLAALVAGRKRRLQREIRVVAGRRDDR